MLKSIVIALLPVALAAPGLVVAQSDPAPGTPSTTGTWVGMFASGAGTADVTLRLRQDGTAVTGELDIKGPGGAAYDVPCRGTHEGGRLEIRCAQRGWRTFSATVTNDTMTGTSLGSSSSSGTVFSAQRAKHSAK